MCLKDLESRHKLYHGNTLVALPLLEGLDVVKENEEVVLLALVVDLGLSSLSASHDC